MASTPSGGEIPEGAFRVIDGGFHVKDLPPDEYGRPRCVHLMVMLVNFRLAIWTGECDSPASSFSSFACYQFPKVRNLFFLAFEWDGEIETIPPGWSRLYNADTGEYLYGG